VTSPLLPPFRVRRAPVNTTTAAKYLGTTAHHVRILVHRGDLPVILVGRKWRFDPDHLDDYLDAQTYAPPPE